MLVVIVAGFTAGFHKLYPFLEGEPISWISSLLFVVETLTTTGYGDLLPFSNQLTSLLATVIMGTGVVLFFIGVPVLLTPIIAQVIRTTPPRRPGRVFEGHTVIIGYDDTVRSILESLRVGDVPAIVVVEDETTALQAHGRHRGEAHVIWGDPGVALTQRAASLGAARHVVVVGSEQEVATTVLAVRDRTSAVVIAIVDDPSFERYIRFAGADYVLSPKDIVGRILARYGFVAADVESVAGAAPGT